MNLSSRKEASSFMLRTRERQGSFYDADFIFEQLIPEDSFYRKFREVVTPLISDRDFEDIYCTDNEIGTEYSLAEAMGSFISEDPIGLAGGINMYAYVGNAPLNFIDPRGLLYTDFNVSIGEGIGVTGGLIIDTVTGDVRFYAGGGLMAGFPASFSVTGSTSKPSTSVNVALQVAAGLAGQVGLTSPENECGNMQFEDVDWFGELGGGTPSVSLTVYGVSDPIFNVTDISSSAWNGVKKVGSILQDFISGN
jgi:hypothetical protein